MKSITLIGVDGSSFFVGLVPASFDVAAWAKTLEAPFSLLQVARVEVREVGAG